MMRPSLALADHDLPDALGAQEDSGGINSQEMLPDIFPQLRDRHFIAANNGTGIVHQNINVAKVLRYLTYHGLNLFTVVQVTPHSLAAPAQAPPLPPPCSLCHATAALTSPGAAAPLAAVVDRSRQCSAPWDASLSAVARPMPFIPPAPVIRAILPSSPAIHYLLCFLSPSGRGFYHRVRDFFHSIREKP